MCIKRILKSILQNLAKRKYDKTFYFINYKKKKMKNERKKFNLVATNDTERDFKNIKLTSQSIFQRRKFSNIVSNGSSIS